MTRLADSTDAWALATIHVEGWWAAYESILPRAALESRTVETREAEFREVLQHPDPNDRIWISERDGSPVAFAYTRSGSQPDIENGGELKLFYVSPGLRGGGIGLPLFEHAIADLRNRGFQPYLFTLRENLAARAWYEKRNWYHDGVEAPWSITGRFPEVIEVRYRPYG